MRLVPSLLFGVALMAFFLPYQAVADEASELTPRVSEDAGYTDPFANPFYVVESDDESASESLNRISGHIDLGFSSPEQSYESSDHYTPSPFAKEKSEQKEAV